MDDRELTIEEAQLEKIIENLETIKNAVDSQSGGDK